MRNQKQQEGHKSARTAAELTDEQRARVRKAVKKTVDQYGETLRMLGRE